ncbi:MAG: winged helix-turn-helix transcriptional regulator [Deltaproteobacteria bacterium]|nr:winged helix-turn-helix transcriptional regulator [Deltaproteobacteria bacterium]
MELKVKPKEIREESVTEILKCKWTILIVAKVIEGLSRPSEIKRAIDGITTKMLNERLRKLEGRGVIKRRSFPGYPLHVEYMMDLEGKRLKPIIEALMRIDISLEEITEVISCKWMIRILSVLRQNPLRTNQIKRNIVSISNKILSERLRKLEQMAFIHRNIIDSTPPGVSYTLTDRGKEFMNFMKTKVIL